MLLRFVLYTLLALGVVACNGDGSPQQPDPDFKPKNTFKRFNKEQAPLVLIDEAHYNFHTLNGRYKPFAQVLRSDGYVVKANKEVLTKKSLEQADILVLANALHKENSRNWDGPFYNAFTDEEISAVKAWVIQGGALFLVADHIPFPKAAEKLAAAFGFEFANGHVSKFTFSKDNKTLKQHPILNSTERTGQVTKVRSLGGDAFKVPSNAKNILQLPKDAVAVLPDKPFKVNQQTPRVSIAGWSQGAVLEIGKGRVAVFAEASMFTSQVYVPTGKKLGLVSKSAEQNERFLLNVMYWLSRAI
ncbi:hypothetical protein PSECIP111951_00090 [Pseudoalteromonas holothuriae]|uniref:DUF4350 domain-containing protein n=1 Tax=Pseudoalteromonas holothuriae TaxID=2963714 RepID=A0ABM9GEU0_9GAMM|nr:DUF4350 domain-containing protein [Pseudoalteromonas sp. CIP111951]CAH9049971.1 hypothetical protein PSECIP111951_00090 [Pseudoalteromonas sp. CIP111951]